MLWRMERAREIVLETGLPAVRLSPAVHGRLELIVCRPAVGERESLARGQLDPLVGLVGDTWNARLSSRTDDGSPHPDMQLNIINARVAALFADTPERRQLAGDQLYIDLALTPDNLPAGTRLRIGGAVIQITDQPHTGCKKFSARFGPEAARLVNSEAGRELRLRGVCAKVIVGGPI